MTNNKNIKIFSGWIKNIRYLKHIFIVLQKDGIEKQFIVKKDKSLHSQYKYPLDSFIQLYYEESPFKDTVDNVVVEIGSYSPNKLEISSRNQEVDFKNRWMGLRDKKQLERLQIKSKVYSNIRNFMENNHFLNVYTPVMGLHVEEGARSFELTSFVTKHKYSLSQSPQIYKQIAMYSGISKYYQICQSFRDEDTKSNRLFGSFDQLDVEMHSQTFEYVVLYSVRIFKRILQYLNIFDSKLKIKIIEYQESIKIYNTDKPKVDNVIFIVINFPLFEVEDSVIKTAHNPFTKQIPNTNNGYQFDIVWDGIEILSGGLRCTNWEEFYNNYSKLIDSKTVVSRYGFLKRMWQSGVPSHGGFAFGLDRILANSLKCRLEDLYLIPFNKQGIIESIQNQNE